MSEIATTIGFLGGLALLGFLYYVNIEKQEMRAEIHRKAYEFCEQRHETNSAEFNKCFFKVMK